MVTSLSFCQFLGRKFDGRRLKLWENMIWGLGWLLRASWPNRRNSSFSPHDIFNFLPKLRLFYFSAENHAQEGWHHSTFLKGEKSFIITPYCDGKAKFERLVSVSFTYNVFANTSKLLHFLGYIYENNLHKNY